jgi:hypothetical protein
MTGTAAASRETDRTAVTSARTLVIATNTFIFQSLAHLGRVNLLKLVKAAKRRTDVMRRVKSSGSEVTLLSSFAI